MKTRRSRKSFEMAPPSARRGRRSTKRRRALNVVNETIVLSDSDDDEIQVQVVDDGDIEVIDVADVSDFAAPKPSVSTKEPKPVIVEDSKEPKVEFKSETESMAPPVINIDDEPDENDDDGVEVLAVVVSSAAASRTSRTKQKRSSLKRKSSNGSIFQMQESIKKAKNTMRRSSSASSKNSVQNPLNKISFNSRQISRPNKQWKNKFQKGRYFQSKRGNALLHNRTRENDRQIVFRTDVNQQQAQEHVVPFNPSHFSFEINPFIPTNASTPAFRTNERTRWIPGRRRRHGPCPAPIAPGSNIMNAGQTVQHEKGTLRPIVIDGSNIAVGHGGMIRGGGKEFSARGIQICVEYFKKRGHDSIVVFVPRYRLKKAECRDPELLEEMERQGFVRFTPSREAGGQRIASYDDLFVVEYAHETGGVIISNDNFKDLYERKQHLQDTIKLRLLQYTWITQDVIMFPEDPLGRMGPSLDEFLRF